MDEMSDSWMVDYANVNINRLIITNDKELYEKQKAQNNVVALLEPSVLKNMNVDSKEPIYLVGWNQE
jgi:hypothetical protein